MREKKRHKTKGKELLKVLGISALAIGIFAAAFIGINSLAFDTSTGAVESLPPVAGPAVIPTEQTPPEGFVEPDITVNVITPTEFFSGVADIADEQEAAADFAEPEVTVSVDESWGTNPSANALSPDDAALIGAQYIWQMFGESIDGKYVTLRYSAHPSQTRAYWVGTITGAAWEQLDYDASVEERMQQFEAELFTFSIDAVTGEWIDIRRRLIMEMCEETGMALEQHRLDPDSNAFYELRRGGPVPEALDEYIQIAKEHASRHFANTEVVSAQLRNVQVSDFGFDDSGNVIATARQMVFEVTDSTGRMAEVSFDEATGELFRIDTRHNDFVPGFRFEDDGQGVG